MQPALGIHSGPDKSARREECGCQRDQDHPAGEWQIHAWDTTPVIDFTDSGIGIEGSQSGAGCGSP